MKGRTRDGREIDLTPWQEQAVKTILAGGDFRYGRVMTRCDDCGARGRAIVLATVEWLRRQAQEDPVVGESASW